MSRIIITGMGLISAIGDSVAENRDSLQFERSGIDHIRFIKQPMRVACRQLK
ncbi:MAG: hypothetical protein WDM78_18165 [Puia sp.]